MVALVLKFEHPSPTGAFSVFTSELLIFKNMKHSIKSPDLYINETGTARGKGVFAKRPFSEGEIVEISPALVLKTEFDALPELLKSYAFNWTALTGAPGRQALILGYGSMYNHDNPANLRYTADAREGVMLYIADRPIKADEELTINYCSSGGLPVSEDDAWFEQLGIDLIKKRE